MEKHVFYTIDRIEDGIAVCMGDNDEKCNLPVQELYQNPHEGDVFKFTAEGASFCTDETKKRKAQNVALFHKLFHRGN